MTIPKNKNRGAKSLTDFVLFLREKGIDISGQDVIDALGFMPADVDSIPKNLSELSDDLGNSPVHTHAQYLTGESLDGYLEKSGGDVTGVISSYASEIFRAIGLLAGRNADITAYIGDAEKRIGGIRFSQVVSGDENRVQIYCSNPESGQNVGGPLLSVGGDGVWHFSSRTEDVSDDSARLATTEYVKSCVPASVGGVDNPVYTDSSGVVKECRMSDKSAGIESVNGYGSGFIRYNSGLQICWGYSQTAASGTTITYPSKFASATFPMSVIVNRNGSALSISMSESSTTGVKITVNNSGTGVSSNIRYIAIGYWK